MPLRLPSLSSLTLAGALAVGLALGAPSLAAADGSGHSRLRIATYNIRADRGINEFRHAVKAVLPKAQIIGLQEVNGYKGAVLDGLDGWDNYRDTQEAFGSGECPILWRSDRFSLTKGYVSLLAEGRDVGDERPGRDSWINNRYATVVRLLDRSTGRRLSVVNVHLPPGATKAGLPRADRPRLHAMFVESVRSLARLVQTEEYYGTVFVTGDFNIDWRGDARNRVADHPYAALASLGLRASWETQRPRRGKGTRGTALLDQVYAQDGARRTWAAFRVGYSDHYPAVAGYELPVGYAGW